MSGSSPKNITYQLVMIFGIITLAVVAVLGLFSLNKPDNEKLSTYIEPTVHVIPTTFSDKVIDIHTRGLVSARIKIPVLPEVSGKVVWVSPKWINGGFFLKDEPLFTIEKQRYRNDVATAESSLAEAKSLYIQEQGHAYVAKIEWEGRLQDDNQAASQLALRKPQVAAAKAKMVAAREALNSAQLNLSKTEVTAPFDGLMSAKQVDAGQFVNAGQQVGILHAIDTVEIRVPLTTQQIQLLDLPTLGVRSKHPAILSIDNTGIKSEWRGHLVRSEGILDENNGILYAIIEVKDPYGLKTKRSSPLRIGAFVQATLQSKPLQHIVTLPRHLLRSGNQIWLVSSDNQLTKRKVEILPTRGKSIYIHNGLDESDRIVISPLANPIEGRTVVIDNSTHRLADLP